MPSLNSAYRFQLRHASEPQTGGGFREHVHLEAVEIASGKVVPLCTVHETGTAQAQQWHLLRHTLPQELVDLGFQVDTTTGGNLLALSPGQDA